MTSVDLTCIKLEALLHECVAAASCLVMLFQHENLVACTPQQHCAGQTPDTTANDDCVNVLWNPALLESWKRNLPNFND